MTRRVDDLIDKGCYACGAGIAGTAHAYLAIAEHTLTLADEPHCGAVVSSRRPVIVCRACADRAGLSEDNG